MEGRTYLRLKDGRGWVCERSRNDFIRYVVEPVGFSVPDEGYQRQRPAVLRQPLGAHNFATTHSFTSHKKTSVIQRTALDQDAESIKAAVTVASKQTPRC